MDILTDNHKGNHPNEKFERQALETSWEILNSYKNEK